MVYMWKLLYKLRYILKYVICALFVLYIFRLLHIWASHFTVNYKDLLPGFQAFTFTGTKYPHLAPKYVLVWERYYLIADSRFKQFFPHLQCQINNCIFTENRYLLGGNYTRFDAILFTEKALTSDDRPVERSRSQIYIFSTIESAYNVPACELYNDNFFNWTFTYRLDSDLIWSYFIVRNTTRHVVAPSVHVKWQKYGNRPISPTIQIILQQKKKAAAWLVSHCKADSFRDDYMTRLQEHLFHFSLQVDVYGGCSHVQCTDNDCEEMFARDYYFYMAFENSFSEDYVTEKVLHGYDNYAVPIVYGAANYNRFLPPGSYLNARELHPYNLAYIMYEAIQNPAKYEEYFNWTNYYTIDAKVPGLHPLCNLCAALNSKRPKRRTYKKFRHWWNGRNGMKWCLSEDFWNETSLVNVDSGHVFNMY